MTEQERNELIAKFESRFSQKQLWYLHTQLMLDYGPMTDESLEALAHGVTWVTFDPTTNDEGWLDFGIDYMEGGTCLKGCLVSAEWAEDFATFLGLYCVPGSVGVRTWTPRKSKEEMC